MTFQLYSNADVVTLSSEMGDSVLTSQGRIVAIGSREELLGQAQGCELAETDLDGATLLPGFVDGHAHLELSCFTQDHHMQLHAPEVSSLREILSAIAARRLSAPEGWLVIRSSFALDRRVIEGRLLDRSELDQVSPGAPVVVLAGLHVASLNTVAMRLLGLDDETNHNQGMTVHRRPDGSLSGIFTEIWDRLPVANVEQAKASLVRHARRLFSVHGITSMSTISTSPADVQALQLLNEEGSLPFRVRFYPHVPRVGQLRDLVRMGIRSGFGDDFLTFGGVKIFIDGEGGDGLGAEFDDLKWSQAELASIVDCATGAGVQLFMHAVTETGIRAALRAVQQQSPARLGALPAPHRIEHSGDYVPLRMVEELAASGLGVVATPHFVSSDVVPVDFQPLRSLVDAGVKVIGATDTTGTVPEGASPLYNVASMVNRVDEYGDPSPQRLSVEEAIRVFTDWSAKGQGEQGLKGVLLPGSFADFAILGENPLRVDPTRIADIEVLKTIVGGCTID